MKVGIMKKSVHNLENGTGESQKTGFAPEGKDVNLLYYYQGAAI